MKIDKKKLERQELGVNKWFNNSKKGTLHYFTGVGKTFTAILCIKRLFRNDKNHSIVILVPSEVLLNQWKKILKEQLTQSQYKNINVFTWNWVLVNDIRIKTNTLVVDEFHEFYSEKARKTINGEYIKFDNNLALTATYKDAKNRYKDFLNLYPIIDEITETEALVKNYISPYIEFNLGLDLSEEDKLAYDAYSRVISKNLGKFGKGGLNLATKCLSGGKHSNGKVYTGKEFVYGWAVKNGWRKDLDLNDPRDAQINEHWNPHKVFSYATNLMNSIRKRKDLLYNCSTKLDACVKLIKKYPAIKSIIFSQSTAFADKLNLLLNSNDISSVVYHSQLKTELRPGKSGKLIKFGKVRLKREAIAKITNGEATTLCTASSLDKGLDIPDIAFGITASGVSNFTQYQQRGGRVKRINVFKPNKVALLVNLYIRDSKDETWLKKRQSQATHLIHWVNSIDEITFNPVNSNNFNIDDI